MQARYQATLQPEQGRANKPHAADVSKRFFSVTQNRLRIRPPTPPSHSPKSPTKRLAAPPSFRKIPRPLPSSAARPPAWKKIRRVSSVSGRPLQVHAKQPARHKPAPGRTRRRPRPSACAHSAGHRTRPRPGAPGAPWLRSSTVTAARRTAVLSVLIGGIRG